MDAKTKELTLIVMDNNVELLSILHKLTRYKDYKKILKWLILSNIKGKNLMDWIRINHDNSLISMVKFITMKANKDNTIKPIMHGKDWI